MQHHIVKTQLFLSRDIIDREDRQIVNVFLCMISNARKYPYRISRIIDKTRRPGHELSINLQAGPREDRIRVGERVKST